ncbi:MAG: TIGR00269 family protein [Thermoplasmata archaeon]|nr:MAG: TIGR00269 family protein [Thermoplasmata archaeon]
MIQLLIFHRIFFKRNLLILPASKMKCEYCEKEAVENIYGRYYCENHFVKYFLGRVRSIIDKFGINGRIAVALSGGKDSSACFHSLHKLKLDLLPFYINLGIESYSEICQKKAEELCNSLGYRLHIIDINEYGINLADEKKPCSVCGTAKRYLMNKFAYENNCKYVATGHNLSDVVTFALNNFMNANLMNFRGNRPYLEGKEEYKMVAKIKPLYWLKDKECMLYVYINRLRYAEEECPHAISAPTIQIKEWIHEMEGKKPGIMLNMAKSFWRLEEMIGSKAKLNICRKCGYASYSKICKFCKIRKR